MYSFKLHKWFLTILLSAVSILSYSQVVLEADGPGNTYELINSVFAPGYNVVENPECIHPEFGRHIAEVWDAALNQYVFEFFIHVTPDNDRCIMFDRQRVEIKTYDQSPENLKGVTGETVVYKWKFRVPPGFQPSSSFTHIHQIKAVGGNDSDPLFTLTPRKGTPNKLELIHNNQTKATIVNLSLLEGIWVEATERIKIDSLHGTYSIVIKKVSDGTTVLSYSNNNLMTIRSDNSFIRPKWGIYRSLDHPTDLRDETMRFAGFSIQEETPTSVINETDFKIKVLTVFPNPAKGLITIDYNHLNRGDVNLEILSLNGKKVKTLINKELLPSGKYQNAFDISGLPNGVYFVRLNSGKSVESVKLNVIK
jgi:hypothetical protein